MFGEEGFLPEPGQVSPARPRQGLGVGRVGAPSVSLVSQGSSDLALHGPFQGTWGGVRGSAGEKPAILAASRREGPGDPLSRKDGGWELWGEGHPRRPASPTYSAGEPCSLWEGCRGLKLQRVTLGSPCPFPCRFWALLERYLPTHSICSLPFVTSFCLGMGTRRVCYGQVCGLPGGAASRHTGCPPSLSLVSPGRGGGLGAWEGWRPCCSPLALQVRCAPLAPSPPSRGLLLQEEAVGPWYHPSAQEIQPLFAEHRREADGQGWVKTHCCLADAWNGGSSLLISGEIPPEVGHVAVR